MQFALAVRSDSHRKVTPWGETEKTEKFALWALPCPAIKPYEENNIWWEPSFGASGNQSLPYLFLEMPKAQPKLSKLGPKTSPYSQLASVTFPIHLGSHCLTLDQAVRCLLALFVCPQREIVIDTL
jgi:hypothetical protein